MSTTHDSAETDNLLEEARQGRGDAFDRLFARHRQDLRRRFASRIDERLAARLDASDIVQETQIEALRRLPDYVQRRPVSFRIWLWKLAWERLQMARRKHHLAAERDAAGRYVQLSA